MKNILKNAIIFYKDNLIAFNLVLIAIAIGILILIFRDTMSTENKSLLPLVFIALLIIGINYAMEKVSKKYIVEIPNEIDHECDGYLLKTKDGEIFKMDEKWIWSPGGKLYKVRRGSRANITTIWDLEGNKKETIYTLFTTIGEIISDKERQEEICFLIFMDKFNPITIYEIYKENNLEIINDCLYIEDALKSSIIKFNLNNKNLKGNNACFDDHFVENLAKNLWIPRLTGFKHCKIVYEKKFYPE